MVQILRSKTASRSLTTHIDMDLHVGDLHPEIVGEQLMPTVDQKFERFTDREIELVQELLEKILPFNESIVYACDLCAELDCLLSFAEAAKTYNYRRPRIVDGSIIDIVQGR